LDYTDKTILRLLTKDPEDGMAALIDGYSGLLWAVASRYLPDEEDVKECVNETFSEFYLHREHFDPKKGSLKGYLAVICQRCATRRSRENRRWEEAPASAGAERPEPLENWEQREELNAALASLDPVDEQIIRMKYYGGMTAREIAASLGLSDETVYKRQQRSLTKMKKFLIASLILALLGVLAACAYVVLRYFGFVPGYGVNTNEAAPFSILEETVATQNGLCQIELEKALLSGGNLELLLSVHRTEESWNPGSGVWYDSYATHQALLAGDKPCQLTFHSSYLEEASDPQVSQTPMTREEIEALMAGGESPPRTEAPDEIMLQLTYALPEEQAEEDLVLTLYGQKLAFRLIPALEDTLEDRFWALGDLGGLLAEPRLEDGNLLVELYDLKTGEFDLSLREVAAVAEDGTVRTGQPVPSASGSMPYDTLDFGPAQPGTYTLRVPYVGLTAEITQDLSIPLPPLDGPFPEKSSPVPGGKAALAAWTERPPGSSVPVMPVNPGEQAHYLRLDLQPDRKDLIPTSLSLELVRADGEPLTMSAAAIFDRLPDGSRAFWGLRLSWPEDITPEELTLQSGPCGSSVSYRWAHPFAIPITVSE